MEPLQQDVWHRSEGDRQFDLFFVTVNELIPLLVAIDNLIPYQLPSTILVDYGQVDPVVGCNKVCFTGAGQGLRLTREGSGSRCL